MQGLILETCCHRACLLLAREGKPLASLPQDGGKELSKNLGLSIQKLLADHPSFKADFVAVGTGPGSYTGVRVGVAMAKALAFGWQVPLLGFCSLEAFVPQVDGPFSLLIDARLGGIYCLDGEKEQSRVRFESPRLLAVAPENRPLYSPQPQELMERKGVVAMDAPLHEKWLARALCARISTQGQSPLSPFHLPYLEGKP